MSEFDDFDPEELEALLEAEIEQYDLQSRSDAVALTSAGIVNWRELTDEESRAAWSDLREWVEWFTSRYQISATVIPDCWWRHGILVEELSALRTSHRALFSPDDSGLGPIGWHERLPPARERLKNASSSLGCSTGGHSDKKLRDWTHATDETAWAAWSSQPHGL